MLVRVLSILDREKLTPNCSVAMHRHSYAVVDILPSEADSSIQMMKVSEKGDVNYEDIGGLDQQKQEIKEAVLIALNIDRTSANTCRPLQANWNRSPEWSSIIWTTRNRKNNDGQSSSKPNKGCVY